MSNNLQDEFNEFIRCDDNLDCAGQLTDMEIIEESLNKELSESSDEEDCVEAIPNYSDVLNCISVVRRFFAKDNKYMIEIENMEKSVVNNFNKPNLQSKITDFFKKE